MPRLDMLKATQKGYSLVELVITIGIISLLVTFTIPQLFQSNTSKYSSKQTAAARDVAFMVLSAYQKYRLVQGTVTSGTTMGALSQYMSYLKVSTTGTLDDYVSVNTSYDCSTGITCLYLQSGGTLFWSNTTSFNGTASTNSIAAYYDPDSNQTGGTADSSGKSLYLFLTYGGKVYTRNTPPTTGLYNSTGGPYTAASSGSYDPAWFTGF